MNGAKLTSWAAYPWSLLIRIGLFLLPLGGWLLYTRLAVAHAAGQSNRGDTGLGLALLLGLLVLVMLFGFCVDALVQLLRRRTWNWLLDGLIIAVLLMPFGWVACNWFGGRDSLLCGLPMTVFDAVIEWLSL